MGKEQRMTTWVMASAGAMVLGSFGPWVKALGQSIGGTDSSNDGWFLVAAALLGALLFYKGRSGRAGAIWAFLAGIAGLGVTIYDRQNIQKAIDQGGAFTQALASVGWGLNLALAASASLTIAGAVSWQQLRSRPSAPLKVPDAAAAALAVQPAVSPTAPPD
jgi:hypothetical protein